MTLVLFRESYLVSHSENILVFRKPLADRLMGFFVVAVIVGLPLFLCLAIVQVHPAMGMHPLSLDTAILSLFPIAFLLSVSLLLIWLSGPQELRIDTKERTYRYSHSWPLSSPKVLQQGSLSDFTGVQRGIPRRRGMVFLVLRHPRTSIVQITVGDFSNLNKAQEQARWLSEILHVPLL